MDPGAKVPTKGSSRAAGHDLYANEDKIIPRKGPEVVNTGLAMSFPQGTYARIAPRSGLAVKHQIAVNAGVSDIDYTGEVKNVLLNKGDKDYWVKRGERIAQLITEKIMESECHEVRALNATERRDKGFGSSDNKKALICKISAMTFGKFYRRKDTITGILRYNKTNKPLRLEKINLSTHLAVKNGKFQTK